MLFDLLIVVLVVGLIVWLANQFLPPPFKTIANVVGVVIIVVYLIRLIQASSGRLP